TMAHTPKPTMMASRGVRPISSLFRSVLNIGLLARLKHRLCRSRTPNPKSKIARGLWPSSSVSDRIKPGHRLADCTILDRAHCRLHERKFRGTLTSAQVGAVESTFAFGSGPVRPSHRPNRLA